MEQQQCLLAAAPREKKEASPSPWWDFFGHCKAAADSSDSEDDTPQQNDDMSSNANDDNMMCPTGPTNSANDNLIIKESSAPLSPGSIVRTTPVKLIGARSNGNAVGVNDGEAFRPDTPGTHDSSFSISETSSSCSSFSDDGDNVDHDDDGRAVSSFHSIGMDVGDIDHMIEEGEKECNFIGGITPGSLISSSQVSSPLKMITTSSVILSTPVPPKDATQFIKEHQPLQLLQSISEEEEEQSNSDDDYNFIGNIEVTTISPFLSTKQRNIRKNAYDLLKRLGEEVNSVEAEAEREEEEEEDNYVEQQPQKKQQQQMEVHEEVDGLKRQLGECTDMIVQLQENLRTCSNDAKKNNGDDVTSAGNINDDDNENDDTVADLHTEIADLKSRLQSAMLQSTQDASQIQSLEAQLQQAHQELSHHHEYEETIQSVNDAVVRSHLYNKEIVKELMVSRKENDDLTMRLLEHDKESEEEEEDELLSLEPATAAATGDGTIEVLESSFADDEVDRNDNVTSVATIAPDAPASLTMTCDQVPSVFHHRQHPLSALQDHLLSCIKLPLRVLSILFSIWIAIILIRIVLIFSLIFVDHNRNSLLEEDGFNAPGIY